MSPLKTPPQIKRYVCHLETPKAQIIAYYGLLRFDTRRGALHKTIEVNNRLYVRWGREKRIKWRLFASFPFTNVLNPSERVFDGMIWFREMEGREGEIFSPYWMLFYLNSAIIFAHHDYKLSKFFTLLKIPSALFFRICINFWWIIFMQTIVTLCKIYWNVNKGTLHGYRFLINHVMTESLSHLSIFWWNSNRLL